MEKRMPQLCNDKDCTGCSSCAQSCAKNAISMQFNKEGYYNPVVETDKCVGCLICEQRCPILSPVAKNKEPLNAYASWIKDDETRAKSSSGGAFSAIAIEILNTGGIVWGAGYTDNMIPSYKYVEHSKDLDLIRGSKYVQCKIGDTYKKIKEQLKIGKQVLFCGTPCHVSGLYAFLNGKFTENLITIDFICHGVPAPKLFGNYIKWLEEKYNDEIVDFNFRESRFGTNYNVGTSATFKEKGKKFLYLQNNSYTLGFCRDLTIHETCNKCFFNGTQRTSDFTIGDFHGTKGEYSAKEQHQGISCLIVNSDKGNAYVERLDMKIKEVELKKIIKSNPSYTLQSKIKSPLNLEEIVTKPFKEVQEKHIRPSLKDKIKTVSMLLLGGRLTYILKNLA